MNKQKQFMGLLREFLTAVGSVLVVYGISDGQAWTPAIGGVMAVAAIAWGIVTHVKRKTDQAVLWSIIRKSSNAIGTALVTYAIVEPDKMEHILAVLAAAGPLLAATASLHSNKAKAEE